MANRTERPAKAKVVTREEGIKTAMDIISALPGGISTSGLQAQMKQSRGFTERVMRELRVRGQIQSLRANTFGVLWFSLEHIRAATVVFEAERRRIKRAMHRRAHERKIANLKVKRARLDAGLPPLPPKPAPIRKPSPAPAVDGAFKSYSNPKRKWAKPAQQGASAPRIPSVFELGKYL